MSRDKIPDPLNNKTNTNKKYIREIKYQFGLRELLMNDPAATRECILLYTEMSPSGKMTF